MAFLAVLIATLADPIRLILAFMGAGISTKKYHLYISALGGALIVEALLCLNQVTRVFGSGLLVGCVASLVHVYLAYYILSKIRARRAKKSIDNKAAL
jgi:hypothetical protein